MNVLITGSSGGIGSAIVKKFLENGHHVFGIDVRPAVIEHPAYRHERRDICGELPAFPAPDILINNAGVQNDRDIAVNLQGTIHVTEQYLHPGIKSIVFIASASASTGAEFPEYAAS
ncbi:MAG: SDR family oxidoreductase, partial [Clostridia bacterium]|nr:SDR family oxidoreductase [Clostridia bacterium]